MSSHSRIPSETLFILLPACQLGTAKPATPSSQGPQQGQHFKRSPDGQKSTAISNIILISLACLLAVMNCVQVLSGYCMVASTTGELPLQLQGWIDWMSVAAWMNWCAVKCGLSHRISLPVII